MAVVSPAAGTATLVLISDFPIDDEPLQAVRQLFGENTLEREIEFSTGRKTCWWPLRVPYKVGEVSSLSMHIFLCAGFLNQRRAIVDRVHKLGCNLELCLHVSGLAGYTSLASATMAQLAELQMQLAFLPERSE